MRNPPSPGPAAAEIDWYPFLARPRLHFPSVANALQSASMLVTGAGGSIGTALSLKLASLRPRTLVLLDSSEQALYQLQSNLQWRLADQGTRATTVLGSVSDAPLLDELFALHQPTLVFHAAAFKHLPLLESQPLAALANNALGTATLADCAQRHGTAKLVLLSTDKAVDPISILGASKRIAEKIILTHRGIAVRLGNVLGTSGSVVETFLHQIASASPLTVTDPNAERYFVTREEAVDLLLHAAVSSRPEALLAPRLERPHAILDLAQFLVASSSHPSPIAFTPPRIGDKRSEALWSSDENPQPNPSGNWIDIAYATIDPALLDKQMTSLRSSLAQRDLAAVLAVVREIVPNYLPSENFLNRTHTASEAMQS